MNLKTMFGIGLVGFGLAFAQDGSYESRSLSEQELQKQEEQGHLRKVLLLRLRL